MLTRKGKLLRKVDQSEAMAALKEEIDRLTAGLT
jgi:hypothetical protein